MPKSPDKARTQNPHGDLTHVFWGDGIYDVVQLQAQRLEAEFVKLSTPWERLIGKSVERGFLGFGAPLVNPEWLTHVLFDRERNWPKGLDEKEKLLLKFARAVSKYHPPKDLTLSEIVALRANPDAFKVSPETSELTLKALKRYASAFELKVAIPMWRAFSNASKQAAPKIVKICPEAYGEPCSLQQAREIFNGDFHKGWMARTLKVSSTTYKVYDLLDKFMFMDV